MSDSHLIHTSLPITPEMFARSNEGDLPLEEPLEQELLTRPHRSPATLQAMEQFILSYIERYPASATTPMFVVK